MLRTIGTSSPQIFFARVLRSLLGAKHKLSLNLSPRRAEFNIIYDACVASVENGINKGKITSNRRLDPQQSYGY